MKAGTRILVVEDDRALLRLLQLELEHRAAVVRCVADGALALTEVEEFGPDAIVLDIMLPGLDGEQVLYQLRRRGDRTPVVMLTARDRLRDKVRNLQTGADDYLTKPFHMEELAARLDAVLRRVEGDDVLRIGDFELNASTHEVRRDGRVIDLTPREYALLELLARNARHVLPRDLILARVWEHSPEVDANIVDVYIGYLRKKLELPGEPRLLHTVRGVGFSLRDPERA